jgi:hypothetical protein
MTYHCRACLRGMAVLGLVLLFASGCMTLDASHPHDPYYEHDGTWCTEVSIPVAQARYAAIVALTELKMPLYQEGPLRRGLFLDTKTPDNFEARINITPVGRHSPATRIAIRVGGFGTHREVCARLLDSIIHHLNDAPVIPALPGGVPISPPPTAASPDQARPADPALPPQPVPLENK